jgi:glycosyltransferase involved in cell wall biosynthesis
MGRIVLILMVKNESRILERCLGAVSNVVDAFCVHDTGSTDNTVEIARTWMKTHDGCVTTSEWKNFGYNRTESFKAAKMFVKCQGWDLNTTYGLLIDADMVFQAGTLREHPLTDPGYTIVQCAGSLEYPNCRLVRMDRDWVCKGVTHEY